MNSASYIFLSTVLVKSFKFHIPDIQEKDLLEKKIRLIFSGIWDGNSRGCMIVQVSSLGLEWETDLEKKIQC